MSSVGTSVRAASNRSRRRFRSGGGMDSERGSRGLWLRAGSRLARELTPSTQARPTFSETASRNQRRTAPTWVLNGASPSSPATASRRSTKMTVGPLLDFTAASRRSSRRSGLKT